jgi:hypothetical protein
MNHSSKRVMPWVKYQSYQDLNSFSSFAFEKYDPNFDAKQIAQIDLDGIAMGGLVRFEDRH